MQYNRDTLREKIISIRPEPKELKIGDKSVATATRKSYGCLSDNVNGVEEPLITTAKKGGLRNIFLFFGTYKLVLEYMKEGWGAGG
jgi:hypothetical protein